MATGRQKKQEDEAALNTKAIEAGISAVTLSEEQTSQGTLTFSVWVQHSYS